MKRGYILLAFSIFVIAGCRTLSPSEDPEGPSRRSIRTDELSDLVASEPARALERISGLRGDDVFASEELDRFEQGAIEGLEEEFRQAWAERRFPDALSLFLSLEGIERVEETGLSLSEVYFAYAELKREQAELVSALNLFLRAPDLSELSPSALESYGDLALSLSHRFALERIVATLGSAAPARFQSFLDEPIRTEPLVEGTVTVWVDRGIRIEGGVGVPDRVIGSGFFVDPRGYIMTNYHVISSEVDPEYEGYSRLYVRLHDNPDQRIPARVIGYDRVFDVALLKVEVDAPYVFSLTDIRQLSPGAPILAIGSPGGLESTITSGIISATGRRFLQMGDTLQVDVPINPGNSGGPLIDEDRQLVGVIFAGIEQFEGVNFAIPSYWIQKFLPELFVERAIRHPWMGLSVIERRDGLRVTYIVPDSPAARAGLREGDRLVRIAGQEPTSIGEAQDVILNRPLDTLLEVRYRRDGEEHGARLSLSERPFSPIETALDRDVQEEVYTPLFGMELEPEEGFLRINQFRVGEVYPGTVADETGISEGDPVSVRSFRILEEERVALLQIVVRKRQAGFLESAVQLGAFLEIDTFL
jgi:S1-C subfamily serine protease